MFAMSSRWIGARFLIGAICLFVCFLSTHAYVEAPQSLGSVVQQSTNIMVLVVEKVDKEKNLIIFKKIEDLKGKHPTDVVKHNIAKAGFHPREWQAIMEWAEPGKTAVFFHNGGAGECCINNYWYQIYPGDWWSMSHGEPFMLRSFAGKPEKLIPIIRDMVSGRETVAPCMIDGNKDDLHLRRAKVQRLKVSLKIQDYNPKRDFVGWGGEDLRVLKGMPGFTHIAPLTKIDSEAQAISIADIDGDGRPDVCLAGAGKVVLLQNGGDAYSEVSLAGVTGCRAAVWADYNGDGRPDLLLATSSGPKLFTNLGGGQFRDDSTLLPTEPHWNLTAAAWLDYDGDGKPDILLGNGYHGLRLYRNNPPKDLAAKLVPPKFSDWQFIGPFENAGQRGFDTKYQPEQEIDLTKEYTGKNDEKARWRKGNFPDGQVHNLKHFRHNDDVCCYLYREIEAASATEMPISLGSDDTLSVWPNGERLLHENVYRPAAPDQNQIVLKLKPGKNQLLIKICQGFGEWAFYFRPGEPKMTATGWFQDVSAAAGISSLPAAKGDAIAVADVNNDGRPDFVYSSESGHLILNTPTGFVPSINSGITFKTGKVGPVFVDFNQDGAIDLFVPQGDAGKLFRNDGSGKFADVSAQTGDLCKPMGQITSAAFGDFDNDGVLDVFIGCLRGPNRYLRGKPDGSFEDQTDSLGLAQKRFNTQAVGAADFNNDGILDVVFVNDGQDSVLLLGDSRLAAKQAAVSVSLGKGLCVVGSKTSIRSANGKLIAVHEASGGCGRGGQFYTTARFPLPPGKYKVEVRCSAAEARTKEITVGDTPMRVIVD
jgi:hypothetical protein